MTIYRVLSTINSDFWDFQSYRDAIEFTAKDRTREYMIRETTQHEIKDAIKVLSIERDNFNIRSDDHTLVRMWKCNSLQALLNKIMWYEKNLIVNPMGHKESRMLGLETDLAQIRMDDLYIDRHFEAIEATRTALSPDYNPESE